MGNFWEQKPTNPSVVELQAQIVVKTLQNCPDLLRSYFRAISVDLLEIRMSPAWLELCSLVHRILEAQNLSVIFNPREKHGIRQQVNRASALMTPLVLRKSFFIDGLANDNVNIRLAVGQILLTMLKKVTEFKQMLTTNAKATSIYTETERTTIIDKFNKGTLCHSK